MANKGPMYGLSRDCHMKTLAKFDLERAISALEWIENVTETKFDPPIEQIDHQRGVKDVLKDGRILCELMNTLHPGSVKKVHNSSLAFKEMENIQFFLRACKDWGMNEVDTFQTQDLYEAKSMYSVVNCLYNLGSLAQKNGYQGPLLGVKFADENKRQFTEEQINEGKKAIGLQYGSASGATQKGMTPYGMPRKM